MKVTNLNNQYSHIYFIDNKCDIYPILPFTDILITDYSSIYADYILMEDKGVILYMFDLEEYQRMIFSLMDYEKILGTYAYTFTELLEIIIKKEDCGIRGRKVILYKWWGNYKERSMRTLWNKLLTI